jgi:hypothetical protein
LLLLLLFFFHSEKRKAIARAKGNNLVFFAFFAIAEKAKQAMAKGANTFEIVAQDSNK